MTTTWKTSLSVSIALSLSITAGIARAQPGARADSPSESEEAIALFAGGCFWCMEPPYDRMEGVISTTSGYTGGEMENPSYEQVASGQTRHAEAVAVRYDPEQVSYDELLYVYWRNIDPFDDQGQFCDRGQQYRPAIFYRTEEQRRLAEQSKQELEQSGRFDQPLLVDIVEAGPFYAAESEHQNYYNEHPYRYKFYRFTCGRQGRLEEVWGNEANP